MKLDDAAMDRIVTAAGSEPTSREDLRCSLEDLAREFKRREREYTVKKAKRAARIARELATDLGDEEMKAFLTRRGVPTETQEKLLDALNWIGRYSPSSSE